MISVNRLTILAITAAVGLGSSALAHGPEWEPSYPPYGPQCGGHMGPMMGPGMTGPHMGHGMMGYGMGPGMMGPGMMDRRIGHGMMGQGMMRGGMGPMLMQRGMGPETMQPLRSDLSADEVKHMIGHRLSWMGNPNIKLGTVEEKDADTIIAEIVTEDGSLVQSLEVDRHTGWMQPVQ